MGKRHTRKSQVYSAPTSTETRCNNVYLRWVLTTDLPALDGAAVAVPLDNVASVAAALKSHVEALGAVDIDNLGALDAPALGSTAIPRKLLHVGVVRLAGHRHVEHHAAILIANGELVASQADEIPSLVQPTVTSALLNISTLRPAARGYVNTLLRTAIDDGSAVLYSARKLWSYAGRPALGWTTRSRTAGGFEAQDGVRGGNHAEAGDQPSAG